MFAEQRIKLNGGELIYRPNYVSDDEHLFQQLQSQLNWQQPELQLFGRRHKTPRLVAFVGDSGVAYQYTGHLHTAAPWPKSLDNLRDQLGRDYGFEFNCALLNYYRNGDDSMGYHSDDEAELGSAPVVASISLGGARDFLLRSKNTEQRDPQKIMLESGSLLLMLPPTQRFWQHALPKRKRQDRPRINLTFRQILTTIG
ncbi:alkylated DNA repair protein [Spongiibacter sp. IMCC21906]|jgi:alkylated DNA repair dioxygenase AlkB|uniref:alpha-ketoglutarate-dependent dioxygenase AlkB family protein n=1 Tax=Spongiibacter sp. IMCC21906 TaxID=1620392 RepID=UPI00062DD415|nr:alpha-ketoglutarate-dependent dioxygenase AlkB [Spongiibacter sp. IMCC21906]AKH69703.1 alkylated DNA repair protein [Spongiibacter sp. IMCC21906]